MLYAFQSIFVLKIEQYTKEPLLVALCRVQGVNEDLLDGQLPLGQSVVVIPQAQLNTIVFVGAKRGISGVLRSQALEEHAVFVDLNEQALTGNEARFVVLLQGRDEVLESTPIDIVEGVAGESPFLGGDLLSPGGRGRADSSKRS